MKSISYCDKTTICIYCVVLTSLLQCEPSAIKEMHEQLRQIQRPALILWGRQDRV